MSERAHWGGKKKDVSRSPSFASKERRMVKVPVEESISRFEKKKRKLPHLLEGSKLVGAAEGE